MLVGDDVNLISLKLDDFGCFGPNLDLKYSNFDDLELFGIHVALC